MRKGKGLYRKMVKAFALAGDNPTTEEEKNAYKIGLDLQRKLNRKSHRKPLGIGYGGLTVYQADNETNNVKTKLKNFFQIKRQEIITLTVVPDTSSRNYKSEEIVRVISQTFRLPIERIKKEGAKLCYEVQEKFAFEIRMIKGEISFNFYVPKNLEQLFSRKIQSVWPGATILSNSINLTHFNEQNTSIQELIYRKHDLYSLDIDSKENHPLGSLFEASRLIGDNEKASVFTYIEPIHQASINAELTDTWRKLREGHSPKKWDFTFRNIMLLGGMGISGLLKEIVSIFSDLFSSEKDQKDNLFTKNYSVDPHASKMVIDNLTPATKQKPNKQIVKTSVWVAAESENSQRASMISRTIANSYGDLSSDNELVPKEVFGKKKKEILKVIETKKEPKINIRANLMSSSEVGKLIQLPGKELIEKYKDINAIKQKEIEVDKAITNGGLTLGKVTFRGQHKTVYFPTKNYDELCLPHVIVGGMGVGKSVSVANKAIEANRNGFGSLIVDPAKGEIGDLIEKVLPKENIIRYNLGEIPMCLDWNEITNAPRSRNRLANAVISFFDDATDEAGAQTARYLKSMVYGMQTGSLKEVINILEDKAYREIIIHKMPDTLHKITLKEFDGLSAAMQTKVKMPIYNRLDVILGDEFLTECMDSPFSLNMVELMEQQKCIILDVPKKILGKEGVNLLINILSSKIDLAMTCRDENKALPFFVMFDELHQMQRSKNIWQSAAVESRKWRIGYTWVFHSFEQVDKKLREIIKDSGPHYTLFKSSKKTFEELKHEILPFTVEHGLKLERHHAINIINADNRVIQPFICKMQNPS